jgi:hypothetical protein
MNWGAIWAQLREIYNTVFAGLVEAFRTGAVATWRESEGFSAGFWTGMIFAFVLRLPRRGRWLPFAALGAFGRVLV